MKKDNKGFTLIEMLGVVVLLGILGTIAVAGTSKYLEQSRKKSFLLMSQSIYEAAQNCQTQGKCSTGTYYADETHSTNNLIKMGYLEELKNPKSSQPNCTANVQIKESGTSTTEYKKYQYVVALKCPGIYNGEEKKYTWPDMKTGSDKINITNTLPTSNATYYIGTARTIAGNIKLCDSNKNASAPTPNSGKNLTVGIGNCNVTGSTTITPSSSSNCLTLNYSINITSSMSCTGRLYISIPKGYATNAAGVETEAQTFYLNTFAKKTQYY